MLDRAILSLPHNVRSRVLVLDNSQIPTQPFNCKIGNVNHAHPPVPLSASQSINYILSSALSYDCEVAFFMHNDAACGPGDFETLLDFVSILNATRPWGAVFTNYDALVCFNMEAIKRVGPWDQNLPGYFSDNDYYRRLRLAGFPTVDTGIKIIHNASETIKSDPERQRINAATFPLYARYYAAKWGGEAGKEKFEKPWGGNA